jgi:subfamily B ATP-binding cassette protein MsbA
MTQLIASVGVATVLTIALIQTRQGEATIGDFVSFVTAMVMMLNPLRHLADINSQLQRGLSAAEGLFSLLDEVEEQDNGTKTLKTCRGTVVFRDVVFRHKNRDRETISGFSLEVPSGATFALVGPSGGGKTSILHLLPRLYEINSGSIEIDGVDISELELDFLRNQISLVSQDVILFNDTIASNIAYGRPNQSLVRVREAVNSADLGDFVNSLEHGLQTVIGDNGVQLSGGQRQRIAVARAILKDAPILLLDEATASLDRHSERKVQSSISQLRKKRTTIIVAHRLSTVIDADQIIVVDHGGIAQRGTHSELLAQPGIYRMLYNTLRNDEE